MIQLLCHLWFPCLLHVALYSAGFLVLGPSWKALALIAATHYFIDRYRLARFVVAFKNAAGEWGYDWTRPGKFSTPTGYPAEVPAWMAVWLLIVADNTMHLTINYLALRYL